MATNLDDERARRQAAPERAAGARQAGTCGCTSRAWARYDGPRDPDHRARRGLLRLRRARQALPRRAVRAVLRERRPRPRRARRGGRRARPRSSASTPTGATPTRARSSWPRGSPALAPGRPEPRLLHLRRLGGGRVGAGSSRAQLPPRCTATASAQGDRARDRLPRHHARRALGDRHHRRCARRSSRSRRAAATCRTRTPTAGPRTATRSGRPTRSRSGSSSRARRRSPR